MKNLKITTIAVLLLISYSAFSQKKKKEVIPLRYEKVFEIENTTKDKLYSKVNGWFVSYFKNASEVIEYKDKETGEVRGNYTFTTSDRMFRVRQTIVCLIKDNKVKLIIKNPTIKLIYIAGKGAVNRSYGKLKRKKYIKKTRAHWENLSKSFEEYLNNKDEDIDEKW